MSGRAHVLVSSRPHPELPADIPAGHPLWHSRPVSLKPFSGSRELAFLARQEIKDLLRRDDGLVADVLGLLTAAAGPLAVRDLAAMTVAAPQSAALSRRIRGLLTISAARSVQTVGPAGSDRYQFAHESLLAYAQADDDLNDPEFRRRIHQWALGWAAVGWPTPAGGEKGTPQYLLDTYPSTLAQDPQRLAQLASDLGWVEASIVSVDVYSALANLDRAAAANPANTAVASVLAAVTGQADNLQGSKLLEQPGYILRQLWMQAAELARDDLAEEVGSRLQVRSGPCLVPQWTSRRVGPTTFSVLFRNVDPQAEAVPQGGLAATSRDDGRVVARDSAQAGAAKAELGRNDRWVRSVAVLVDGRVVTGGDDGRVLVWDPSRPGAAPAELGRHDGWLVKAVWSVAALADGRVVTGGNDGRVLVWDPSRPGAAPAELGHHHSAAAAVAVLADGRVVTGGNDGRVLVWDPSRPGAAPAELGHHHSAAAAVAVLADGRVVTGGNDGRVLVWDPSRPGAAPAELGQRDGWVRAVAVLADGRVVTGGNDGRVLVWDPSRPGATPAKLGGHGSVLAVAVLAGLWVVTGGDDGRVLVWDPTRGSNKVIQLDCLVSALATASLGPVSSNLVIAHQRNGVSLWSFTDGPHTIRPAG